MESVSSIGERAFDSCNSLVHLVDKFTQTNVINSVESVYQYAFNDCTSLTEFLAPYLTSIYEGAFKGCTAMTKCDLGIAYSIDSEAFKNCYMLTEITLRHPGVVDITYATDPFANTPLTGYSGRSATVYVPADQITAYQQDAGWSTLYSGGHVTFAASPTP